MPFRAQDITFPPAPEWLRDLVGGVSEYVPDLISRDMSETPAAGIVPDYFKDWLQGIPVNPPEMMHESMTNWAGGGSPLAQIAERSGAKNFGAFLHRTMDPEEFGFLDWLKRKGKKSEAASSAITPTYRSIFHPSESSPGVVFSVRDPENIRWWSPEDIGSKKIDRRVIAAQKLWDRYGQLGTEANQLGVTPEHRRKMDLLLDAFHRLQDMGPGRQRFLPEYSVRPGREASLSELLEDQKERLLDIARTDPGMTEAPYYKLINEVGYRMDPEEMVGVRIPRGAKKLGQADSADIGFWGEQVANEAWPGESAQVAIDFAKRHNLPIWQFSPQTMPGEAAHGIMDYLGGGAGRWYKRRTEEFPMGLVESSADPLSGVYGRQPLGPWLDNIEDLPTIEHLLGMGPYKNY